MNCAPVPEALEYSGGNFQNLVAKYANPEGIREYDNLALGNHNGMSQNPEASSVGTETIYGMTPNSLSFATRDYLQRYGLVNSSQQQQQLQQEQQQQPPYSPRVLQQRQMNNGREEGRILDITAIKNQRKLL